MSIIMSIIMSIMNPNIRTISQNSIIKFKMNIKKKIIIKSYIMKFIIIIK